MGHSPNTMSQVATLTLGTPGVVTAANHTYKANDPVVFATTGALPTGLTAGTTYYVAPGTVTSNSFSVAASPSGAPISFTGSQSGTQSFAPPATQYRVIRIHKVVTEAYVNAGSAVAAKAAARALAPQFWKERHVMQNPASEDTFEYDVVSSDDGT